MALLGCGEPPCGNADTPTAAVGQGNVLIVVLDDVGVEALAPWDIGPMPARTPTIDCLCERGLRFTQAWASPVCSPTRGEVQTGRYSRRQDLGTILLPNEALPYELPDNGGGLAKVAGRAGYRTGFFGKWHLAEPTHAMAASHPNRFGFDRFAGSIANLNTTTSGHERNDYCLWQRIEDGVSHDVVTYPTTTTVDDALEFVGRDVGPWLVVLSFNAPHVPLHRPPEELVGEPVQAFSRDHGMFLAMIEAVDSELGRFLRSLPPETLANTTIVLFGDNGTARAQIPPQLGLSEGKGSLAEAGVRVPVVVAGLGVLQPGVSDALVHVVDILPTVVELVGGHTDALLDGRSWLPVMADSAEAVHSVVYSSQFGNVGGPPVDLDRALRGPRHKWMVGSDGVQRFFEVGPDRLDQGADLLLGTLTPDEEAELERLRSELAALEKSFAQESGRPVAK
jgi:arylsulfatase A-like enzyme